MDYATLAVQLAGGVLGTLLAALLLRELSLGFLGNVVVGIVGGALSGLILTDYLALAPAGLPDGTFAEPEAILAQAVAGGAGGAILMMATGFLTGRHKA